MMAFLHMILQFLKDSGHLPTATVRAAGTSKGSSSSNTKKEAVQLPQFCGDEEAGQAFLKYPILLKNQNLQILDYKKKYRARMLLSHIDNQGQNKSFWDI